MARALGLAGRAARRGPTPFGAVLVDRRGRVVGRGHNTVRADRDPTAHGEVAAIRDAGRRLGAWWALAGTTRYGSCEPCLLCAFVITQVGIARVVFAARGRASSSPRSPGTPPHPALPWTGAMAAPPAAAG
jgi:tRNA(adenine34) deaminase